MANQTLIVKYLEIMKDQDKKIKEKVCVIKLLKNKTKTLEEKNSSLEQEKEMLKACSREWRQKYEQMQEIFDEMKDENNISNIAYELKAYDLNKEIENA